MGDRDVYAMRYLPAILNGSLVIMAALGMVLALRGRLAFLGAGVLALVLWRLAGNAPPGKLGSGLLVALTLINVFGLVPELGLRLIDFEYDPFGEFVYPRPADFAQLQPDAEVFWRLPPAAPGVNSLGFPGEEIDIPKPEGTFRILFLGDSISQQGYPVLVEQILNAGRGAAASRVESVVLAVNGYSSYQGRMLAEQYGRALQPDLVVVQFGWNDHWLALGQPDAQKNFAPPSRWQIRAHAAYRKSRALQGYVWAWQRLGRATATGTGVVRVPPAAYRQNLLAIRSLFEAAGVPVVFVTAPAAHARLGVPQEITARGFAVDADSVVRTHRQYNRIVRQVAREGWLLDMEARFDTLPAARLQSLFQPDGIHLSQDGMDVYARWVADFLKTVAEM